MLHNTGTRFAVEAGSLICRHNSTICLDMVVCGEGYGGVWNRYSEGTRVLVRPLC